MDWIIGGLMKSHVHYPKEIWVIVWISYILTSLTHKLWCIKIKKTFLTMSASFLLKIRPWDAKVTLLEAKVSFINFLRFWLILFMFILVPEFLCFFTLNLCLLPRSANGRWPWIQSWRVDKYFKIQVGNLKVKSFYKVSHWILWVFKCYFRKFKTKCTFLNNKRKTNPG